MPADTAAAPSPVAAARPPAPLSRRLLSFVYEGVLLFGIVMLAGFVYGTLTGQRHALQGLKGLQAFVFLVVGAYFMGFWCRVGQTLPMRTWHILLVDRQGRLPGLPRAGLRYLLAWSWFLPALAVVRHFGIEGAGRVFLALALGVLAYGALALLGRDRQFLHDRLCGTRLVDTRAGRTTHQPLKGSSS
jgi:uncharacterized RDD family membrane protein YckC